MIDFDYHTHTTYSHGSGSVMDNAESAVRKGLKGIAITDHGFNHPAFGMRRRRLPDMKRDCVAASEKCKIPVLLGVEANIIGTDGKTDVKTSDYEWLDVFLAGVHRFVILDSFKDYFGYFAANLIDSSLKLKPSNALVRCTTKAYVNAIKSNPLDVLTHLNFCCFADSLEVAKCLEDYGTYLEINTKKVHLTDEEWQNIIDKTNVRFVVDSDAHSPERVGDAKLFEDLKKRIYIPENRIDNINGATPVFRFAEFKKRNG